MPEIKTPAETLLLARRAVDGMRGVTILDDWVWIVAFNKWALHCRLSIRPTISDLIPVDTDWFILVDDHYPNGSIDFYPANENGISVTFQHQRYNGEVLPQNLWRSGNICLTSNVMALERMSHKKEPFEAQNRLKWYFDRALQWLEAAAKDELTLLGEPFELPDFPITEGSTGIRFGFNENPFSFQMWNNLENRVGLVDIGRLTENALFAIRFSNLSDKQLYTPRWGNIFSSTNVSIKGIWFLLDDLPVLRPWQAPSSWGELRQIFRKQNIDLDYLFKQVARKIRDDSLHLALIGFPIPKYVGDAPCLIQWQATLLPQLSSKGKPVPKGFRQNEHGYWERDKRIVLTSSTKLSWVKTENWHEDQITTRGRLPQEIFKSQVLLLGVGALGSVIAELLVRAGVQRLLLIDNDNLEMGNLVRHTLTFYDISHYKAESVSRRLNSISPHTKVDFLKYSFHNLGESFQDMLGDYNLIIDCSGSDSVLRHIEQLSWGKGSLLFSLSLSLASQRLYCYSSLVSTFSFSHFTEEIMTWINRDWEEYGDKPLPLEGIGCWHPVFPARFDDVVLLASLAIKFIENKVVNGVSESELVIFEQQIKDGVCYGVNMVRHEVI